MHRRETIVISTSTILKAILLTLAVGLLFYLRDIVLIVLTSIVIASAIEPGVRFFRRYRLPRVFAVLLVYVISIGIIAGIFYAFAPLFLEELSTMLQTLPQYLGAIEAQNAPYGVQALLEQLSVSDILQGLQQALTNTSAGLVQTASAVFGGLLTLILVVVFSFYFSVQETGVDDFLRVVVPASYQERVQQLWKRSQDKIGRWMQGQLALAVIVGVLVYLGLTILGVPYALLLGMLAAIFELIPVFGPILSAIPAAGLALSDGGFTLMLLTIGLFLIIQQFENHLIYPLVVTKVVGVPPLLVILALLVGGKLAGFLGIILSVPAAAVIQELVGEWQKHRHSTHTV